jgi:hypothetical protein
LLVPTLAVWTAILWGAGAGNGHAAVIFGQLDDFESGTDLGWNEGFQSPNAPAPVPTGGEHGTGDAYLRNLSAGGIGAGSKLAMFNSAQWAGNYNAAGVTRIGAWVANFGPDTLNLRVNIFSSAGEFSSTRSVDLAPDGLWRRVHFDLRDSTRVAGAGSLGAALSNVTELNLLSAPAAVARGFQVPGVNAVLGVDDLRAMRAEGDANFDGVVNGADLLVVRANLGRRSRGRTWENGDFDFDGRVTARDLVLLRQNLGGANGVAAAGISVVPEPAAIMALLPVLFLLLAYPRRRRRAVPVTV